MDDLTRLLCEAMEVLEAKQTLVREISIKAVQVVARHNDLDQAPLEHEIKAKITEAEKVAAVAKLTPHERKLLGLPCA
jgi:hypothetical protein